MSNDNQQPSSSDSPGSEDDVDRVERTDVGASVQATLKRGEGTRDQDEIRLKGKGEDAEAAIEEFEKLLRKYEEEWSDRVRAIQPDEEEGED